MLHNLQKYITGAKMVSNPGIKGTIKISGGKGKGGGGGGGAGGAPGPPFSSPSLLLFL